MRISTLSMVEQGLNAILERQSDLNRTQLQLATGRRILTPADDPAGAAQALRLGQEKESVIQFQRNITQLVSKLSIEEGVLSGVGSALQRVRELAVQGVNATSTADGPLIAVEIRQLLDEILGLANTKDANGEYLFSGYQGKNQTFVDMGGGSYNFQGDVGQQFLQISPSRQIASSDSGRNIFVDIPFSGGGSQDIFKTLYDFAADLDAGTATGAILTDIDAALDKVIETRSLIGARMNSAESQQNLNEQALIQLDTTLSDIQDLDFAEAVGRLNLQLTSLEAAQQVFQRVQGLSLFNFL